MKMACMIGACITLVGASPCLAQNAVIPPPNLTAPPPDRAFPEAPIGHRQPRADEVPQPQSGQMRATEEENAKQDAVLDRRIKGICKGC